MSLREAVESAWRRDVVLAANAYILPKSDVVGKGAAKFSVGAQRLVRLLKGNVGDLLDVDNTKAVEMLGRQSNTTQPERLNDLDDAISILKSFGSVNGARGVRQG